MAPEDVDTEIETDTTVRVSDCGGPRQTFAPLPFSMAPEDVDTEIETDTTVRVSDCGGPSQTFAPLPFSMAPEDVDTEIETDTTVRDIYTLLNTMHDLRRQLEETERTVREQNETIQQLLARQGTFDISQPEELLL